MKKTQLEILEENIISSNNSVWSKNAELLNSMEVDEITNAFVHNHLFGDGKLELDTVLVALKYNKRSLKKFDDKLFETRDSINDKIRTRITEELKKYLREDIFIGKPNQNSPANKLIDMLLVKRSRIEYAEIAKYLMNMSNGQKKVIGDLNPWLKKFYSIVGSKGKYIYRTEEIKPTEITKYLKEILPKK